MKYFILLAALFASCNTIKASEFKCVGTEPFWGGTLSKSEVLFSILGSSSITEDVLSVQNAQGTSGYFAVVFKTNTSTVSIINQECNDGMSDVKYSHHVLFDNGKKIYYGCCSLK